MSQALLKGQRTKLNPHSVQESNAECKYQPATHRPAMGDGGEAAASGAGPARKDCLSCRVIGTVVPLGCAGYLAAALGDIPAASKAHRITVIVFAAGFAAMGLTRAMI